MAPYIAELSESSLGPGKSQIIHQILRGTIDEYHQLRGSPVHGRTSRREIHAVHQTASSPDDTCITDATARPQAS